jgi:hypothetical protein
MNVLFTTRKKCRPRRRRGITRRRLLELILPGLNALFGLEYAKYGEEHQRLFKEACDANNA